MITNKFTYGDKIEIINYGHVLWGSEEMMTGFKKIGERAYDINPELLGRQGTICDKELTQDNWTYGIEWEDGNKSYWYNEEQLKLAA